MFAGSGNRSGHASHRPAPRFFIPTQDDPAGGQTDEVSP